MRGAQARAPVRSVGVVPRFRQNARRLEQHAEHSERWIDPDRELRLDAKALRAVAVPVLDAALRVAPVAAHVPLADGAGAARLRIGPAHDADDEITGRKAATLGSGLDRAERFMAQARGAAHRGSRPVKSRQDLAVGAAHAQRQGLRQNRTV